MNGNSHNSSSSGGAAAPAKAAAAPGGKTAAVAAATAPPAEDVWTEEQHKAFVAAIQKFPSSLDKTLRWKSIGEAVPGKTTKQCLERFKVVRSKLIARKEAEKQQAAQGTPAAANK